MLSQAPANSRRRFTVCIICLEFQKSRDIADARLMLKNARREPKSVDQEHLDQVERDLDAAEETSKGNGSGP
jgi:hypothetical protein